MTVIRWMLRTSDRVGMIQEVVQIFSREGVSIVSMEVSTGQIFIKFYLHEAHTIVKALKKALLNQEDILNIKAIPLQPYE